MHFINEHNILLFLIQIFILLALARGLGEVFRIFRQPPITAEILIGVVLGPTILGRFFPQLHQSIFPADPAQNIMLQTVAWLGAFFLLLEAGLEIDFASAWRQKADAVIIAVTGLIIPLGLGFIACLFLPDKYFVNPQEKVVISLFLGGD